MFRVGAGATVALAAGCGRVFADSLPAADGVAGGRGDAVRGPAGLAAAVVAGAGPAGNGRQVGMGLAPDVCVPRCWRPRPCFCASGGSRNRASGPALSAAIYRRRFRSAGAFGQIPAIYVDRHTAHGPRQSTDRNGHRQLRNRVSPLRHDCLHRPRPQQFPAMDSGNGPAGRDFASDGIGFRLRLCRLYAVPQRAVQPRQRPVHGQRGGSPS